MTEIRVFENPAQLSAAAAARFVEIAAIAISQSGHFTVALSGGSTPAPVYKILADKYRDRIDWTKVIFFFGDERNVPPDSDRSNFRMASETLFGPLGIAARNIYRWQTELGPKDAAAEYERILHEHGPLDLNLLGLGEDAHTASLFPHTPALDEKKLLAVANWVEKLGEFRLTMTFPAINASKRVIFLVSGEAKAGAVAAVLEGEFDPVNLPAQRVKPGPGRVQWLLDKPSASDLTNESTDAEIAEATSETFPPSSRRSPR
jgi:6-phosphogluconolactonase